jgi:DNA-binding PadR family transcriptional regulator
MRPTHHAHWHTRASSERAGSQEPRHYGFDELRAAWHRAYDRGRAYESFSLWHGLWHAIGRHRHRHGGGPLWGGRGDHGFGDDDGLTRGRKFTSDDLQLMLLALIAEAPRHGYELIKALEARSNGFYAPSPGMVYPALTYLEELGYVTVQQEGNRKRYEIAEAGRAHLEAHRDEVDMMLAKLSFIASKMESMRRAYAADDDNGSFGAEGRRWHPKLIEARYALKLAIVRHADASEAEQRRIAEILMRAAAEIEGSRSA